MCWGLFPPHVYLSRVLPLNSPEGRPGFLTAMAQEQGKSWVYQGIGCAARMVPSQWSHIPCFPSALHWWQGKSIG